MESMSRPTIEGGVYDESVPSKQPLPALPGIGLHDLLHDRQACRKFYYFTLGFVRYAPGRGYFRAVPSQNRDKFVASSPQLLNDSYLRSGIL